MTIQQMRALIPDTEMVDWEDEGTPSYLFTDEQLQVYLDLNEDRVKRAVADAIETLATSEVLISKVIKTEDLQTDGAKVATALLARARQLRASDDEDQARDNTFFDVVPFRSGHRGWGWF